MSIIFQSILGRRLVCLKSQKADANKAILLTATRPDFTSESCWQLIAAPFTTCHFPRDAAADRGRSVAIMKALAAAILSIVAASCGSRDKPVDPMAGLEASEKVAVMHLSQEDRERYLRDRPLAVIREYLWASQMRPDEIESDLVAVQRARRSNTESGWRMIMVGGGSLLVFHVSDDRQWKVLARQTLEDSTRREFIFLEDDSGPKSK